MFNRICLIIAVLFIIGGLSGVVAYGAEKNYTTVLKDGMGRMLVTIDYRYIGKRPQGQFNIKAHNWQKIDTDFYKKTLTNHTGYVVEFLTMTTWLDNHKNQAVKFDLKKLWRSTTIGPYSGWTNNNSFYFAPNGENQSTRHCVLEVSINGAKYKIHDKLVYSK